MHPAVELALARMKTHPEDFIGNGRWNQAINDYKKWFSDEELKAITAGLREMRMEKFQQRLFELMTYVPEPEIDLDMYGRPNGFGLAPIAQSGQPVNYGLSNITTTTGTGTVASPISNGATGVTWVSPISDEDKQEMVDLIKRHVKETKQEMLDELSRANI